MKSEQVYRVVYYLNKIDTCDDYLICHNAQEAVNAVLEDHPDAEIVEVSRVVHNWVHKRKDVQE